MSQSITLLVLTLLAAAGLLQKRFVTIDGNYPAAGAFAVGVAETDAATGDNFAVNVSGTAVVEAGGAIAKGAEIEVGASGKAVTRTSGVVVGWALEASAADTNTIEILLAR